MAIIDHGTLMAIGTVQQLKERMGAPNLEEVFVRLVEQGGASAPALPTVRPVPAGQYDWG